MRLCFFSLVSCWVLALFAFTGCERAETMAYTAEIDEPGYRRGKDLLRQGRNQEALSEFQKVIDKRGLNSAPESHLEVGLLYQQHIRDPLAAIFHYRKFRELRPNSPQADLVRQRIDAATREFARTLPAQPLENQLERLDMTDVLQRLQRENEQLKAELALARSGQNVAARPAPEQAAPQPAPEEMPIQPAPEEPQPTPRAPMESPIAATPPTRPTAPPTAPPRTPPTGAFRRHTVVAKDTLFSLAQRYYNNRSRWRDIYAANRDVMKSETDLRIGMELKIPQ